MLFLEKVSPALEHVDCSSGAIGTAVNLDASIILHQTGPDAEPARVSKNSLTFRRLMAHEVY